MSERDEFRDGDLRGIYIESGIAQRTREAFCRIDVQYVDRATGKLCDAVGQLSPDDVRSMARQWFEVAEAAVHDMAVFAMLTSEMNLDEAGAAQFVAKIREHRADMQVDEAG